MLCSPTLWSGNVKFLSSMLEEKEHDARVRACFANINLSIFCRPRYCRRRPCFKSYLSL